MHVNVTLAEYTLLANRTFLPSSKSPNISSETRPSLKLRRILLLPYLKRNIVDQLFVEASDMCTRYMELEI